jgi:two-component SAPR family response regulator
MSDISDVKILIVEDDYLVAQWLALELNSAGCEVIGPVPTAELAIRTLENSPVDVAILDVQLAAGTSASVARAMLARDLGFVFLTGFSDLDVLPEDLRGYRMLQKPLDPERVRSTILDLVAERT